MNKKASEVRHYEIIVEKIKEMILDGTLKAGERLPSERDLAEQFQVSRIPVREAIKILEYTGVLESHMGDGIYVRMIDMPDLASKMDIVPKVTSQTLIDLAEYRIDLEACAAFYAAQRFTPEDQEHIQKSLDAMRAAKRALDAGDSNTQQWWKCSMVFHKSIVLASHNSVLISVYESLYELLDMTWQFTQDSGISYNSILAHEAIFLKIIQQDSKGASTSVREHLTGTKEKLAQKLKNAGFTLPNP